MDRGGRIASGVSHCSETRCLLCQRTDPPFERAVAYGSYDGGLRDLIHVLKFQQVRPAAAVLGRMLAETIANLEQVMPVGTYLAEWFPFRCTSASRRSADSTRRR